MSHKWILRPIVQLTFTPSLPHFISPWSLFYRERLYRGSDAKSSPLCVVEVILCDNNALGDIHNQVLQSSFGLYQIISFYFIAFFTLEFLWVFPISDYSWAIKLPSQRWYFTWLHSTNKRKIKNKKKTTGPTESRTRIAGFKVQSASHYTMGPQTTTTSLYFC